MLKYKITTAPTVEPITVLDAAQHCRITGTAEDGKLAELITAAREYAESATGKLYAVHGITAVCDSFPDHAVELPIGPIITLTALEYTDHAGTVADVSADVIVDDFGSKPRLVLQPGKSWPAVRLYPVNPIKIVYTAGMAPSKKIRSAMLLLIGHWFENREEVVIGQQSFTVPFAAEALLQQERHPLT